MDNYYYHLLIDFSVGVTKYLSKFAQFLIFVKLYSKNTFCTQIQSKYEFKHEFNEIFVKSLYLALSQIKIQFIDMY